MTNASLSRGSALRTSAHLHPTRTVDSVRAALRAVAVQHALSTIAFLSIFVVLICGVWGLRRWTAGRRGWRVDLVWVSACSTMLLFCGVAFVFSTCGGGQVGEFGKNRLARAYGAPVVAALEAFHRDSAAYPRTLAVLVPRYLSAATGNTLALRRTLLGTFVVIIIRESGRGHGRTVVAP